MDRLELVRDSLDRILTTSDTGPARLRTELASYIRFPQKERTYRRQWLFFEKGIFEILLLCWRPGACSPVHDHGGSAGVDCVLDGRMFEETYNLDPMGDEGYRPILRAKRGHRAGDVLLFSGQMVHAVSNPADLGTNLITLNVYIPHLDLASIEVYDDWLFHRSVG